MQCNTQTLVARQVAYSRPKAFQRKDCIYLLRGWYKLGIKLV